MTFQVRYTRRAVLDIERQYECLLVIDPTLASEALEAIEDSAGFLAESATSCRQVEEQELSLYEYPVKFGSSGFVILFEIECHEVVTVLAVRRLNESDSF
jgi:ribosomal protein S6